MALTEQQQLAVQNVVAGDTTGEQATILRDSFGGDLEAYANWFRGWWASPTAVGSTPNANDQAVFDSFNITPGKGPQGGEGSNAPVTLAPGEKGASPSQQLQPGFVGPALVDTGALTQPQVAALTNLITSDPTGEQAAIFDKVGGKLEDYKNQYLNYWNSEDNLTSSAPTPADKKVFDAFDLAIQGGDGQEIPWDEAFAHQVINDYVLPDIGQDPNRRKIAEDTLAKYGPAFDSNRKLITDLTVQNKQADGSFRTGTLQSELDNNNVSVDSKLGFLSDQLASLKGNLSGELASKAANLETLMGTMREGIGAATTQKDDATRTREAEELRALDTQIDQQRIALVNATGKIRAAVSDADRSLNQALATQIETQLAALTSEAGARRTALTGATAQMGGAIDVNDQARKSALATKIAQDIGALSTEVASKKTALETERAGLTNAVSAQDVARRAALDVEIGKLNAAQGPINEIRIGGAEALGSAINLGVQSERDRIEGQAALAGYIGGSTGTDSALLRASIAGRQGAAQAMTGAKLENAQDNARIAGYGANSEKAIGDQTAENNFNVGMYGSKADRALSDFAAEGNKSISDFGSNYGLGIDEDTAKAKLDLSYWDANEGRMLTDSEAAARRAVQDAGAISKYGIANQITGMNYDLTSKDAEAERNISDFAGAENRGIVNTGTLGRFANANENANLNLDLTKYGADQGKIIGDTGAIDLRNVQDYGANKTYEIKSAGNDNASNFFSADLARRIGSLGLPGAAAAAEFDTRNMADSYGMSGLKRALQILPAFYTSGAPAPSITPTTTIPNTAMGTGLQNIGAGLVGAGLNYAAGRSALKKAPATDYGNPVYPDGGYTP